MKKRILFVVAVLLLGNFLFSQNYAGARVAVLASDLKNFGNAEVSWLSDLVSKRIAANLGENTDFNLIDATNESEIKKLQKKSETAAFDEKTAIEAGKLLSAEYVVFSSITKDGSNYSLTCNFTNVTTSATKIVTVTGKKSTGELYDVPGCAVDEITIKLCEQLGIFLTQSQIYVLQYGEAGLSDEAQLQKAREEEEMFKKQIADCDAQIKKLALDTSLSASAEAQQIEAARNIYEGKLKAAQQKAARLLAEAKKKEEDAKRDAERSAEQKKRRDEAAKLAEEKTIVARKKIQENSSIYAQLNVIEAKKKALVEIRDNIEERVSESNESLQQEMEQKISEIQNKPYNRVDLENGVPTEIAKANRESQIEDVKREYKKRISDEENNIRNSTKRQEDALYNEILSDYKMIANRKTITSVNGDIKYSMGEYNGKDFNWEVELYLYSEGIALAQQQFFLNYKDLTGKNPVPEYNKKGHEDYSDTVDLYDSWFRRGDPILTFEVDCSAKPRAEKYPSQYEITFLSIRVKDTVTGKVVCAPVPSSKSVIRKMPTAYDIRAKDVQKKIEEKEQQRIEESEEKERKRQAAEEEKRWKNAEKNGRYADYLNSGFFEFRGGVVFDGDDFLGGSFGATMNPSRFFFLGANGSIVKTPEKIEDIMEDSHVGKITGFLGFKVSPRILYYPPTIYVTGGIGAFNGKTKGVWINSSGQEQELAAYFLIEGAAGIVIPIASKFGVYAQMEIDYTVDIGVSYAVQAGINIRFF